MTGDRKQAMDHIKNQINKLKQEIIDLRRDFHMYPELGFQEFKSAEKVEAYLQNLGFKTKPSNIGS